MDTAVSRSGYVLNPYTNEVTRLRAEFWVTSVNESSLEVVGPSHEASKLRTVTGPEGVWFVTRTLKSRVYAS